MGEKKFKIQHWHIVAVMLMVYDTIVVNFAYAVALWLRFDCRFSAIDIKYLEAWIAYIPVSYTHLRAHETDSYLVCRLLLEKKKTKKNKKKIKKRQSNIEKTERKNDNNNI